MAKVNRPQRTSINGIRNRLTVDGKDPDFQYRIVNDTPGRVQQFIDAGYEIVTDEDISVGDKKVATPGGEGTPKKLAVGNGVNAYVMRIRKDWYEEDEVAEQARVDETEASMRRQALDNGLTGEIKGIK
jgi:hypothetical protein